VRYRWCSVPRSKIASPQQQICVAAQSMLRRQRSPNNQQTIQRRDLTNMSNRQRVNGGGARGAAVLSTIYIHNLIQCLR